MEEVETEFADARYGEFKQAVADAVGARLFELPITAEKIYHALKQKNG